MVSNLNLLESRRRILLNTPHIETVSDTIVSFKTDVVTKLKGCKVYFTPIQEGTGDPSPDNVRPITGWNGVEVTACGKNLCPLINDTNYWSKKAWFDSNGVTHSSTSYVMCDYKKIPKNGTYFLSSIDGSWKGIGFYDESYNPLKFNQMSMKTVSLTTVEGAVYYRVYAQTGARSANIQFELGSIATPYEPYTETTLTIPFNRTIYGGYVDLVRGEVVEEWTKVVLDGVNKRFNRGNYTRNGAIECAWVYPNPHAKAQTPDYLVENLPIISYYYENGDPTPSVYMPNGNNRYVILYFSQAENPDVTTQQQIVDFTNNYLSQNPVTIAYPIATPNTYTLTPETIKALKGVNNIWSNTNGNIEVSYYSH